MMDLSHLSDAELESIASGAPKTSGPDLASMSDEDLQKIASQGQTNVVQEMHPEFTTADRLIVKNLSNNNEAAVNYLQKKHPDLEVAVDDKSGQIIARKRDGSEPGYKVLDPDTGFFSKDFLYDAGDIVGDVIGGAGSAAATAAGAVGGLPGAAAAGAAASGGIEALREALGKAAGLPQDLDPGQIATAAALGGANPFLFGTGVAGASERGLLGKAAEGLKEKVLPKVAESVTGIPKMDIKTIAANPGLLDEFAAKGGALGATEDTIGRATKQILQKGDEIGSAIGEKAATATSTLDSLVNGQLSPDQLASLSAAAKDMAPEELASALQFDISKVRKPLVELREKYALQAEKYPSPENISMVQRIQDQIDHLVPEDLGDKVSADVGQVIKKKMDKLGKASDTVAGTGSKHGASAEVIDKEIASAGMKGSRAARDEIDRLTGLVSPDGKGTAELNQTLHQLFEDRDHLANMTSNPKSAWLTLSNLSRDGNTLPRQQLARIDQRYGTSLVDDARKLSAAKHFGDASLDAASGGGTTSTSRTLGLATKGAAAGSLLGGSIAGPPGAAVGGLLGSAVAPKLGSPAAVLKYVQAGNALSGFGQGLPSPLPAARAALPTWFYLSRSQADQ